MTTGGDFRRLIPPPRRRPGLLAIFVRWRAELLVAGLLAGLWLAAGGEAVLWAVVVIALLVIVAPPARGPLQAVVAAHRVRSGLVQAGVTDRSGRLPWIMTFRPRGDAVLVTVWLRSGTTIGDLRGAIPVITTACGAAEVKILQHSPRQDRAVLVVERPRWGWPTR